MGVRMRKHRRRSRRVSALLLAAMLTIEPIGTLTTVYAAEDGTKIVASAETDAGSPSEAEESWPAVSEDTGEEDGGERDSQVPDSGSIEDGGSGDTDSGTPGDQGSEMEENPGTESGEPEDEEEKTDTESLEEEGKNDLEDAEGGDLSEGTEDTEEAEPDEAGMEEGEETADDEETEEGEDSEDTGSEDGAEQSGEAEEKIAGSFTEMSSDYRLTSEQLESKRDLAAHLDEISDYQEGVNYVKGQVITFAQTQEEAELIAEAYNARIVQFEYGILTLQLQEEDTVIKAMRTSAGEEINLPAVWPNYYRYALGETAAEPGFASGDPPEDTQNDPAQDISVTEEDADDYIEIEIQEYETEENGESAGTDDPEELSDPADDYLETMAYSDPFLQSTSYYYQYHHTVVGSAYAWAAGSTGRGIKVAVLDTGVANQTEVTTTSIYRQGNSDSQGHGTHVAGIIGAKANGIMGVGVAPDVTLYSGSVIPNGSGTDADIMGGIRAAKNKNVDIINMSLGGIGYNGSFQTVVNEAYKQGIAIFAAAGNDGGTNYSYPACYDNVISVAATNESNGRAYFSNYGNKVDLSAPGVNIWSTGRNGGSYVKMNGTSMACPVAAGEAAVILSGNAEIRNKQGKARVDALERLMKSKAVKAGSGMGSGITMLPKALQLNTAAAKPAAPGIRLIPNSTSAAQSVRVVIEAPDNVKVYYTTDGQNPVYKNGVLGDGSIQYSRQFTINDRGKATVKAIAVNESGVSSAVRSATYTLKPYVSSITISGVGRIAQGKSVQLKAEVLPAYAANKKVNWELYTVDGRKIDSKTDADLAREVGVSISSGGKVTASAKARTGSYHVRATSRDDRGRSSTFRITVIDTVKIESVKLTTTKLSLTLPDDETYQLGTCLEGKCKDGTSPETSDFKWSSSNETVVKVSSSGIVTALRPGKATITALANDSSGRKATCSVTVLQQITGITISDYSKIAAGKSQTFKATVFPAASSNKKVTWTLLYGSEEVTAQRARDLGVRINASSGKLTTTSKAVPGFYTVKAVAQDGSGMSAIRRIKIVKGSITGIAFTEKTYSKVTLFRKKQTYRTPVSTEIYAEIKGTEDADLAAYEVTNSNPGIASVTSKGTNGRITLTINATGVAAGRTVITVRATDGSNKKISCSVTVRNPVSGIRIAPSGGNLQYMSKGKRLQLKAIVETENGAVSSKGVKWEIYGGTGVSISSSGKIKAGKKASTGYYNVYATAKDGSGVMASYQIGVVNPTTWIKLYSGGYLSTKRKIRIYRGMLYSMRVDSDSMINSYTVSSSNPSVVSGSFSSNNVLRIVGNKKGSATITVKALDGSGKKVKYRFTVK